MSDAAWRRIAGIEGVYIGRNFNSVLNGRHCYKAIVNEAVTAANVNITDSAFNDVTSDYIDTANVTTLIPGTTITFKSPIYSISSIDGSFIFVLDGENATLQDPAITALLAQAATDGYTAASGATLTALDTYVKGLKADGIWDKLDLLYVFATNGDSDFATYNLKDPASFQATKVNAPTFTSNEGFTGNGSSSYLTTGWTPSISGVNFTADSASMGVYTRSETTGTGIHMGAGVGLYIFTIAVRINGIEINIPSGVESETGFEVINDNNGGEYYLNGSQEATAGDGDTLANQEVYILCRNNGGATNFADSQVSIAFAGADLSTESSDFYTHTQNYMTALGKEV